MQPKKLISGVKPCARWLPPLTPNLHSWGIFSCTGAIALISCAAASPLAQAAVLESWQFDPATNQLEIRIEDGTTPRYLVLDQPPLIVLDLPNTQLGQVAPRRTYSGSVRQIRVSQFQPQLARIVIELSPEVVLSPAQVQLEQVGLSGRSARFAQRWVLRPLVAEAAPSVPRALPPARFPDPQMPVVRVPPLQNRQSVASPSPVLRPLTRQIAKPAEPAASPVNGSVVEFGEPLPNTATVESAPSALPTFESTTPVLPRTRVTARTNTTSTVVVPPVNRTLRSQRTRGQSRISQSPIPNPQFSIPNPQSPIASPQSPVPPLTKGTLLSLYYPGEGYLKLPSGPPRQEVLLLAEELRDRKGRLIAPANTPVIGRFESSSRGSRFIVQAISLRGRNVPFAAKSDILSGDRRVSGNQVGRNSGIGALAGFLLGGISGIGLLVGAAAGATATVLAAPQPATIEPGQIIEVRLTDDWY